MNDKWFAVAPQEKFSNEESRLLDASLDVGHAGLEQFRTVRADLGSNQTLEKSGVLPIVELFDAGDTTQAGLDDTSNNIVVVVTPRIDLDESGERVQEIPVSGGLWIEYDNGTRRIEYDDGGISESRPNGMGIWEDRDHNIDIQLPPDGEWLHRSPSLPDKEITRTQVTDEGDVIYSYKDGTAEHQQANGDRYTFFPDGSVEVYYADGTVLVHGDDKWWHLADEAGTVTQDKHGHVTVEDGDGNVVNPKVSKDGTKRWDLPNGTTVTQDKEGNVDWKY